MGEQYKPQIARARLHTAGKTVEQIREELHGQGFTYKDFQNIVKTNNYLNGLEVWVSKWNWDSGKSWHLWNWKEKDDEKIMLAMYHAEQYHPMAAMRPYKNDFDAFRTDWQSGEYDPGCSYTFQESQVEILEVVQEEENNLQEGAVQRAVNRAKEEKEQQHRKYRATKKKYRNRRKRKK